MTLIDKIGGGGTGYTWTYVYRMVNPPTGAHNITTTSSAGEYHVIRGVSYTGAKQTGIPDAAVAKKQDTTSTDLSLSVTPSSANSWAVYVVFGQRGASAGTNSTYRIGSDNNTFMVFDSNGPITAGTAYEMHATIAAVVYEAPIMFTFAPATTVTDKIEFDAATDGNFASGTSRTFAHPCTTANNRILFVHAFINDANNTVTGVTYGGTSMTLLEKISQSPGRYSYVYYLANPATGTNNVVISSSASKAIGGNAISYYNARQTGIPDAYATETSSSQPYAKALTTTADNCWMLEFTCGNRIHSAVTNAILRKTNTTFTDCTVFDNGTPITPAGSYTMTTTYALGATNEIYIVASFAPYVPSGTSPMWFQL